MFVHANSNVWTETTSLLKAFVVGARFDTKIITILLLPILLLAIGEAIARKAGAGWRKIYVAVNTLLFTLTAVLLTVDFFYYSFFQSHIDQIAFALIKDDTAEILKSAWTDFPLFRILVGTALLALVAYGLFWWMFKVKLPQKYHLRITTFMAALLIFVTAYFYGLRGTFSTFPLQMDDSTISSNPFINQLTLNGIYTLQQAVKQSKKNKIGGDPAQYLQANNLDLRQLVADFLQTDLQNVSEQDPLSALRCTTPVNKFLEENPPHVIILQMESMGTIYFTKHSRQLNLLGKLADVLQDKNCYVFKNFMPATNGTIGTLEHFVTQTPFVSVAQSPFYANLFSTATALPFLQNHYQTNFITGAKLGWRNINNYLPAQGFGSLEGREFLLEHYPDAIENDWGVFDEYMFDRMFEKLEHSTAPQYIFGMTTTNHTPYVIPNTYTLLPIAVGDSLRQLIRSTVNIDKTTIKNLQTYQYACDRLGKFIDKVKNSPFGNNTIIVASGDHNLRQSFNLDDAQLYWMYSVPMVAYIPEKYLAAAQLNTEQWAWHGDIFPTIYGLALSNTSYIKLGRDLTRDTTHSYAVNSLTRIFADAGVYDAEQNLYFRWKDGNKHYLTIAPELADDADLQKVRQSAIASYHLKVYLEYENTNRK
ncbi:phosphoglycerol transferase [Bacteroidia bacterium]|nr:phosphoglycerol transferase [Bacteroidia bacterium]